MMRCFIWLWSFALPGAFAASLDASLDYGAAPKHALVIGNTAYGGALALRNAANDARLINRQLLAAGYTTELVLDADRNALFKAVGKLAAHLKNGGVGVLYYAGHGVEIKGRNYLIPVGGPVGDWGRVAQSALPLDYLLERLRQSGAHLSIVLLDACRNDPADGGLGPIYRGGGTAGFAAQQPANGMLIAYATQPGERALDGAGANGPFALALSKWLVQPGLPIEQAMKHVMTDVRRSTRDEQRPWLATSMVGDFTLVPAAAARPTLSYAGGGRNVDGSTVVGKFTAGSRGADGASGELLQWFQALNGSEQMDLAAQIARQAKTLNRDDVARLTRQANGGSVVAEAVLGLAYRHGFGVGMQAQRSHVTALRWFRKAAGQQLPFAQNELGEMLFMGQGTARNVAEAERYFERAAAHGYMPARLNLLQLRGEAGAGDPARLFDALRGPVR